jgi:tetratricopeptide (TPR) repeat protein
VLTLVGVQPALENDENPAVTARMKESIELANELIKSKNPKIRGEGYLLLGQAMAKQGRRTEGLKEFSKGLELLYPGIATREMTRLVDEHPAFQQPDVSKQPNPFLAEQFFGRGLHLYFDKKYEPAEKQFQQAIKYFGQDARYRYYLGLAQLAQKTKLKRDAAYFSFEEGARLEAANRPFVADINTSLERIQGELRQQLNSFRQKALEKAE